MQNKFENRAYANFFIRLVAFVIDNIVAHIAVGVVKLPLFAASLTGADFLSADFIFQYSVLDIITYAGVALYFTLFTYYGHTTLGKMMLGLEVISDDDDWTFINILYRETVGRFLSGILFIGYFFILAKDTHQGFHDMLCDTYVVYKNLSPVKKSLPVEEPSVLETVEEEGEK